MTIQLKHEDLLAVSALLVHASKIDENYSEKEKSLIKSFIKTFAETNANINNILIEAENIEKNSNQLLNFTNVIKQNSIEFKSLIIKELWKIVLSDKNEDIYESNLIRRVCGLIYFPDKMSGDIKLSLKVNK